MISNKYFEVKTKPYIGMDWTYVDAKKVLLSGIGKIEETDKYVLIKQFRPPVNDWVITAPMGAFPCKTDDPLEYLDITKKELESETGYKITLIEPWFTTFRSSGWTNEKLMMYKVIYSEEKVPLELHPEEEIIPFVCSLEELENSKLPLDASVLPLFNFND